MEKLEMGCYPGVRTWYKLGKNKKGEDVTVQLSHLDLDCSLGKMWKKRGVIPKSCKSAVTVDVWAIDEKGNVFHKYDPQTTPDGRYTNFDWMLEDSEENRNKIIAEVMRLAGFENDDMSENLKSWYTAEYPSDELGSELAEDVTFEDIFNALDCGKNIYEILGVHDSVVRERVFKKLAEKMGVEYSYIYEQWVR